MMTKHTSFPLFIILGLLILLTSSSIVKDKLTRNDPIVHGSKEDMEKTIDTIF